MLRAGQRVTINGAAGTVAAEVLHTEQPAALPVVTDAAELARVQAIMVEMDIVEIALLGYDFHGPDTLSSGGRPVHLGPGVHRVMLSALRNGAGEWRDLHGHRLTITEAP